jgi:cytochrome c-type biogenesis protein CcmH/NrfF
VTPLPLAHLGHWWTYILYGVPVAIVLFSVVTTTIRERREQRDSDDAAD